MNQQSIILRLLNVVRATLEEIKKGTAPELNAAGAIGIVNNLIANIENGTVFGKQIDFPLSVFLDGRTWNLFSVDYSTADGDFQTYVYALSWEHAAAIVEELKETAKLNGQVAGIVKHQE